MHFSLAASALSAIGFASVTAVFASCGFILETLFSIELLLTSSKHEFTAALFAD